LLPPVDVARRDAPPVAPGVVHLRGVGLGSVDRHLDAVVGKLEVDGWLRPTERSTRSESPYWSKSSASIVPTTSEFTSKLPPVDC